MINHYALKHPTRTLIGSSRSLRKIASKPFLRKPEDARNNRKVSMEPGGPLQGSAVDLPRQWRAIVFADLVESVRLMQDHGFAVIDRWRAFVAQVRGQLPAQGGRLVRTAGDGLLIECERVSQALAIGFALHDRLELGNAGRPADQRMQLRIGLHFDELQFDVDEAYGSGVNIAARVAAQALPGQTLLTAEARQRLSESWDGEFEDLGQRYAKNLKQPLRLFAARAAGAVVRPAMPPPSSADLRPAVAVLPFSALPGDVQGEALGHALADEIIALLARHPGLRVLSRASTAALGGPRLDADGLQRIERVLGASYVLSGRLYHADGRLRVLFELASVADAVVCWSEQLSSSVDALFAGEDELVPRVAAQVGQQVQAQQLTRVRSLPMESLPAYALYLGASGLSTRLVQRDFERAREAFEHLQERHPRQAAPVAQLARWHLMRVLQGWSDDRAADAQIARGLAERALALDPGQAEAHSAMALVSLNGDKDAAAALTHNQRAIALDPKEPGAWAQQAAALSNLDRHAEAQASAEAAIRLSPLDPNRYLFDAYAGLAALAAGQYGAAVSYARSSLQRHLLHAPSHRLLVAALWLQGEQSQARAAAEHFKRQCSAFAALPSPPPRAAASSQRPIWYLQMYEALEAAGANR